MKRICILDLYKVAFVVLRPLLAGQFIHWRVSAGLWDYCCIRQMRMFLLCLLFWILLVGTLSVWC
jgi:hypothetical protein